MSQLYLPADHTDADLVLAGQIAELIDSAELYVAWTPATGQAAPEVVAELRDSAPSLVSTLGLVLLAVRELWCVLRSREPRRALPPVPDAEQRVQQRPAA